MTFSRGEWHTDSPWLPCEIPWQLLWKLLEKDSLLCACFAHWLHSGTKMGIWDWELLFGVNHPAASLPFLLCDRFPSLFLLGVIV